MNLARTGEFGMIDRIADIAGIHPAKAVLGIGDDAALFETKPGLYTILTTDAMVEGVHFDLSYTPFDALGWKAIAASISDVAAMGGIPDYVIIAMGVPAHWQMHDIEHLYKGMVSCCGTYECEIVGGDTVRSVSKGFLAVSVVGQVKKEDSKKRSGAASGDMLCVSGHLGGARTGLEILQTGADRQKYANAIEKFLHPKPRVDIVMALSGKRGITSMIDISDGLGSEIHHLCARSGLGCVIHETAIPVDTDAEAWCQSKQVETAQFVFESGEEFELLFTLDSRIYKNELKQVFQQLNIHVIGEMSEKETGPRIQSGKKTIPLQFHGWDHFKK